LDSKPRTLQLVHELNLKDSLMKAREEGKTKYVAVGNRLYSLPTSPKAFLSTKLLTLGQKLRVLGETFVPKGQIENESVYDFGKRRLGGRFADYFLDPMVSGIYAGNAREISIKAAFPKIIQMEQEYGSLLKGLKKLKKNKSKGDVNGMARGTMTSFSAGMGEIICALEHQYENSILTNQHVRAVSHRNQKYYIYSGDHQFCAEELYVCAPAYAASHMLHDLTPTFSELLSQFQYVPVVVVGLLFKKDKISQVPQGYGYLIPSKENKEVMGVLFESNIFAQRCDGNYLLCRVLIGGAMHPMVINESKEELIKRARKELESTLNITEAPEEIFFAKWDRAIPQYNLNYLNLQKQVKKCLSEWPHLHLVSNYWNGVSFNDCIENAFQSAEQATI